MATKLVLVQPPLPANERHKRVLPLGLAYLAAYIREKIPGLSIQIVDGQGHNMPFRDVIESVLRVPCDRKIVGVTYWTCQAPAAFIISRELRKREPGVTIIHGGIHTTIAPEDALEVADFCVLHEGEETFYELLQYIIHKNTELDTIRGIGYCRDGEKQINSPRPFIDNLDRLPFPAWDLLDMNKYDSPLHVVGGNRLPVIGSRGCPYGCTYCGSPLMWKRRVRWRSPENVLAEIRAAVDQLGLSQFHFWDDNLMLNRKYIEKLCRLIVDDGLSIKWTGLTRASHIAKNADLMGLMREAGCIGLEVGIESANPKTFYTIQKDESLQIIEEVARLHKKNGMNPLYTYMAFNPGETISGYYEQARFIDKLISDLPWYEYFHPMPFPLYTGQFSTPHMGTKMHDEASSLGEVLVDRMEDYHHHRINFVPNSLLDDIPLRNMEKLDLYYYRLCTFALTWSFWSDFNAGVPLEQQRAVLSAYRDLLHLFWKLSNGKRSLRDISAVACRRLGLNYKQTVRFCAFTALILGQIGAIKSAVDDRERRREVVVVAEMNEISDALKPVGDEVPRSLVKRVLSRLRRACTRSVLK